MPQSFSIRDGLQKCAGYQRKARVGGFSYAGEKAENLNDFES
jgi:hypothetical protein